MSGQEPERKRDQICLRCDWSGEAGGDTCPDCGTVLYRMPPPRAAMRSAARPAAPPPVEDVFVSVPDRAPVATQGSRRRAWIAGIAVAAVAATAIAALQVHGPGAAPAGSAGAAPGLRGSLVYATRDDSGWVIWSWDLTTGDGSPGPHVPHPVEMVDASDASPGWIGVTSAVGGRRVASLVHSVTPASGVNRIASGKLITWGIGGQDLTTLRYGPPTKGCIRRVQIRSYVVAFGTSDRRFDGPMCGVPLTIARDGTFDYVVATNGPSSSIRIIGSGYTERFIDDHVLLNLSEHGDFLVVPVPRPGEVRGHGTIPGLQLIHGPNVGGRTVSFGTRLQPFLPLDFLAWSWDESDAYILGSYRGVRGIYRLTVGPGVALREPQLIEETDASSVEATVSSDGALFLLLDGRLSYVRDGRITPLDLPAGMPPPGGPILWTHVPAPVNGVR